MKDPKVPGRSRAQLERDYRAFEKRVAKQHKELFGAKEPPPSDLTVAIPWVAIFLLLGLWFWW